jgi:Tfp pilus assembly protein PilO
MRRNEATIGAVVAVIAVAVGFWLLVLAPKREEAGSLKDDVGQLRSQLEQAQQSAAAGEQAKKSFPADYRKLVVLGKAVPQDADQGSLLVQLQKLAERSGVRFQSIDLADEASASPTSTGSAPATDTSTSTSAASESDSSSGAAAASSTAQAAGLSADPTEASAALLPIGASVGPAGLPVMPYELAFVGSFFEIADFMKRVDSMVRTRQGAVVVDGRLLTVDGFTLSPVLEQGSSGSASGGSAPRLIAELSVTTYLTPAEQGATAGATPNGPSPATATPTPPTPASGTTPTTSSSTPTSSTSP